MSWHWVVVTGHLDMTVLSLNQDEQQNYKTVELDMDIYRPYT